MLRERFVSHRIAWSRAFVVAAFPLVLFGSPPKVLAGWVAELLELLGFALLVAATLWRIWCHLFIAGWKDGELSIEGPYSVVRNPLYVGNFLGVVGFGLAVELPYLALAFALAFLAFYPAVVDAEEKRLEGRFGGRYRAYRDRVPRWIPDWPLYREPGTIAVSPRHVRRSILDAMWFLWAFALWEFIEELHKNNLLPRLF